MIIERFRNAIQLRRRSLRIPTRRQLPGLFRRRSRGLRFHYFEREGKKAARTMEIRSVAFPIPRPMMADNDDVSHSTPSTRGSLTKATGPEGRAYPNLTLT